MKIYNAQYILFHGVSKGLGVDYDETKIIKPVFESGSFEDACRRFYLDSFSSIQRYLPQTNGEVAGLLFDFSCEEKNLIEKVSQSLHGLTTQSSKMQSYNREGFFRKGILIRVGFYEKLLIEEHGIENYAFIENLKSIIHPHLKVHNITP
jgi:hypothetical protein